METLAADEEQHFKDDDEFKHDNDMMTTVYVHMYVVKATCSDVM